MCSGHPPGVTATASTSSSHAGSANELTLTAVAAGRASSGNRLRPPKGTGSTSSLRKADPLEEQLAARVEAEMAPPPGPSSSASDRSTMRPMAVSQSLSTRRSPWRTSGVVRRSDDVLACQPNRSLGSSRPWLTRSTARPRTPDDPPVLDRDVQRVAVRVQDRRALHPLVHVRLGHTRLQVAIDAHGSRPAAQPGWQPAA